MSRPQKGSVPLRLPTLLSPFAGFLLGWPLNALVGPVVSWTCATLGTVFCWFLWVGIRSRRHTPSLPNSGSR